MNKNENIIANWKPIHDKGLLAYVIPYALSYFIILFSIAVGIFLINRQNGTTALDYIIVYNVVLSVIVTLGRVIGWFRREKQYNDILYLFEMASKCPACSAKTSPEDGACPSCGLMLGTDKYNVSKK